MLAHQLGYRLPVEAWAGIWWWDKLWKQYGFGNESSKFARIFVGENWNSKR